MRSCPICQTKDVQMSHRKGFLERGALTWIGILPFRCGQCQTRFLKFAAHDPRRRRSQQNAASSVKRWRAPRWSTNVGAVVTVYTPGQANLVLRGEAENASLEGVRLRLPVALPEDSQVSVALESSPSRFGTVCWVRSQGKVEAVHGIRFHVLLERRGPDSRPWRRLRTRRLVRRMAFAILGLLGIAAATYGLVWLIEGLRGYNPKYYEPKDIERQTYDRQRRANELKRTQEP